MTTKKPHNKLQGLAKTKILKIDQIVPDPNQPRSEFDPAEIESLSKTMESKGNLDLTTVRPIGKNKYMIINGERRWRAAKLLGWKTLEVRCFSFKISDLELFELQIIANNQNLAMNPIEDAVSIEKLIEGGRTEKYIAEEIFGKSPDWVKGRRRVLNLSKPMQEKVSKGKMRSTEALSLSNYSRDMQPQIFTRYSKMIEHRRASMNQQDTTRMMKHAADSLGVDQRKSHKSPARSTAASMSLNFINRRVKELMDALYELDQVAFSDLTKIPIPQINNTIKDVERLESRLASVKKDLEKAKAAA